MATGKVIVTVVDVGQGQCTFVEIYDDASPTPKLIHTLLFDCGTDKQSADTQKNLQYIADKVSTMTTPTFDCIVFSHSDKDHVSLTDELLEKFEPEKKPTIKTVWYGGNRDQYKKRDFNILNYLVSEGYCTEDDIKTTGANYSGYSPDKKRYLEALWLSTDKSVILYPVAVNALTDDLDTEEGEDVEKQKTAEARNRVSIICQLSYAAVSYVICGDATNKTMAATNTHFKGTTVFDNNIMTTLPHHGSRTTGYAVKSGAKASDNNKLTVTTFAALMKSKTITVSAYQKHSHPSLEMMVDFAPDGDPILKDPRLAQKNAHRVTANIDVVLTIKSKPPPDQQPTKKSKVSAEPIPKGRDRSAETVTNMFTTNYNVGTPTFSFKIKSDSEPTTSDGVIDPDPGAFNTFACWKYITKSDGKFTVEGYKSLAEVAAFTEAPTALLAQAETPAPAPSQLPGDKKNVSVRMKLPATGKPVNTRSGFQSRLMQFR